MNVWRNDGDFGAESIQFVGKVYSALLLQVLIGRYWVRSRGSSPVPGAGDGVPTVGSGKGAPEPVPVPDIQLDSRALQQYGSRLVYCFNSSGFRVRVP